jgi:hypothetical protein
MRSPGRRPIVVDRWTVDDEPELAVAYVDEHRAELDLPAVAGVFGVDIDGRLGHEVRKHPLAYRRAGGRRRSRFNRVAVFGTPQPTARTDSAATTAIP